MPGTPEQADEGRKPIPVEIHEPPPKPIELFDALQGRYFRRWPAGIVILFVIFILLQREDLRDRAIRLLGASDMQRATSAMNDAAERLSKYFLRQVLINSAYGIFIALGLWLIGVPSPIVWGILAMLMRFVLCGLVHCRGTTLNARRGRRTRLDHLPAHGALYLVSELTMGQVVEPLVFGHGTGVSPIAVIISTVFGRGCGGRSVSCLPCRSPSASSFLAGMSRVEFLRGVTRRQAGAYPAAKFLSACAHRRFSGSHLSAELALKDEPLASYLDDVALKGLQLAERDFERGALDEENLKRIHSTVKEIWRTLPISSRGAGSGRWSPSRRKRMQKKHKRDWLRSALAEVDEEPLPILSLPISRKAGKKRAQSCASVAERPSMRLPLPCLPGYLTWSEGTRGRERDGRKHHFFRSSQAKLVCLSFLAVRSSSAQVRYLVRRLRRILPSGSMILVGCWTDDAAGAPVKALKETAEADACRLISPGRGNGRRRGTSRA